MRIQLKSKIFNSEIVFVLYLFVFTAIKPILLSSGNSLKILFIVTVLILLASLSNSTIDKGNFIRFVGIVVIILSILGFDMVFRPNSIQSTIPYTFLVYGIIPLFLMINIQDFKAVLKYYCIFSICVGCMYLKDPFVSYKWSSDYMQFGFLIMLPAFAGAIIAVYIFKKRICCIFIGIFGIELLLFGNKGAFLTAAILYLTMYFVTTEKNERSKKLIFLMVLVVVVTINMESIFRLFTKLLGIADIYSYSLTTFNMFLFRSNSEVTSARINIWINAWNTFLKSPIWGHGTVYLEGINRSVSGYAHNIVLDIMVSYGILGLIVFIYVINISFKDIVKTIDEFFRNSLILFIVISIVPLMFSLTFWKSSEFWVLIGLVIYRHNEKIWE